MIQVSDAYKELIKSNIRPKCEPIIKVFGKDNNGNDVEVVWNAKDIKDLKYKRGCDPIGREKPYMELTWTEIYTGTFDEQNYPEKYNNIIQYMAVELSFVQNLAFYNTWKTFFSGNKSWKDLFSMTWKEVKNQPLKEVITMPRMFLEAQPTIKGKTITWVARDFLFFCDRTIQQVTPYSDTIPYFAVLTPNHEDGYTTGTSPQLLDASQKTSVRFGEFQEIYGGDLTQKIVINTVYSDLIFNYLKLKNFIIKFDKDGSLSPERADLIGVENYNTIFINKNIMYSLPELTKEQNISNYSFSFYTTKLKESQNYETTYSYYDEETGLYVFEFDGFGEAQAKYNENHSFLLNDYSSTFAVSDSFEPLIVTPFVTTEGKSAVDINEIGVSFIENNPINPYRKSRAKEDIIRRADFFKTIFNQEYYILKFECLPILTLEPCDVIYVDKGLSENFIEDYHKERQSIITEIEITYNGAIKQKMTTHEWDNQLGVG